MIVAGIDVGGKNVHIVLKKDGQILGKVTGPTGIKKAEAVEQLYDEALKKGGPYPKGCRASGGHREFGETSGLCKRLYPRCRSRCPWGQ